jgi:hypothetical protein
MVARRTAARCSGCDNEPLCRHGRTNTSTRLPSRSRVGASAQVLLHTDPVPWVATLRDRNDLPLLRADDLTNEMLTEVGVIAVHVVAEKRSTFSRANVFAEVLRQIHGVRFASADDRMAVVERTVHLALSDVLLISAPELAHTPERFTRPDRTSKFRARGFEVYTTQALLDAEARLLDAGRWGC